MARPLVRGISTLYQLADTSPLESDEFEDWQFAIAAYLYQRGPQIDAWYLIAVTAIGTTTPRAAEWMAKRAAKRAKAQSRFTADEVQSELLKVPPPPDRPKDATVNAA